MPMKSLKAPLSFRNLAALSELEPDVIGHLFRELTGQTNELPVWRVVEKEHLTEDIQVKRSKVEVAGRGAESDSTKNDSWRPRPRVGVILKRKTKRGRRGGRIKVRPENFEPKITAPKWQREWREEKPEVGRVTPSTRKKDKGRGKPARKAGPLGGSQVGNERDAVPDMDIWEVPSLDTKSEPANEVREPPRPDPRRQVYLPYTRPGLYEVVVETSESDPVDEVRIISLRGVGAQIDIEKSGVNKNLPVATAGDEVVYQSKWDEPDLSGW